MSAAPPDRFERELLLPVSADDAFAWHERPGALRRLLPPWENVEVLEASGGIRPGGRVVFRMRLGPLQQLWEAVHDEYRAGARFVDVQVRGPFAHWRHEHRFEADGEARCRLQDRVEYRLPCGRLGRALGGALVARRLAAMFRYRHEVTRADLAAHRGVRAMKIAISGATGLVGTELTAFLRSGGHEVRAVVRDPARRAPGEVLWDPARGTIEAEGLEDLDAVVHLAGANVAAGRWSAAQKERIRESRVAGTRLLARTLAGLRRPPSVLVAASAVGIYGDRGDEVLTEGSALGRGFLAEVAEAWEAAAEPAAAAGIRTVHLRLGVVLSPRGGALRRMLTPFRLGLGGRLGDGRQWFPWIAIDDVLGVVLHALTDGAVRGPVNTVAPEPVPNGEFTSVLARVLRRPAFLPVPRFALRLLLGEMADGLLLASVRAVPDALRRSGYAFRHPGLEGALRHLLGR